MHWQDSLLLDFWWYPSSVVGSRGALLRFFRKAKRARGLSDWRAQWARGEGCEGRQMKEDRWSCFLETNSADDTWKRRRLAEQAAGSLGSGSRLKNTSSFGSLSDGFRRLCALKTWTRTGKNHEKLTVYICLLKSGTCSSIKWLFQTSFHKPPQCWKRRSTRWLVACCWYVNSQFRFWWINIQRPWCWFGNL